MIYGLRRTDWWVVVTDSLVFIDLCLVFGIAIPDLVCMLRLESAFRSRPKIYTKLYNHLAHEYSIRAGTAFHFPLTVPVCMCATVQAGAAGVSYWERPDPEVHGPVSLHHCRAYTQGE